MQFRMVRLTRCMQLSYIHNKATEVSQVVLSPGKIGEPDDKAQKGAIRIVDVLIIPRIMQEQV